MTIHSRPVTLHSSQQMLSKLSVFNLILLYFFNVEHLWLACTYDVALQTVYFLTKSAVCKLQSEHYLYAYTLRFLFLFLSPVRPLLFHFPSSFPVYSLFLPLPPPFFRLCHFPFFSHFSSSLSSLPLRIPLTSSFFSVPYFAHRLCLPSDSISVIAA